MTDRQIDQLRRTIESAGGLVTLAEMARAWDISTQRAHQLAAAKDLPAPIAVVGGRKLWLRSQLAEIRKG